MSQTQVPEITGKMLMYERPVLLNKEQHAGLGIKPLDQPYAFCAKLRAVPLSLAEVPFAYRHYPIIFTGRENPVLLAVLGVVDDLNLYVDEKGVWDPTAYVPSYVRRYPFAVAAENDSDRFAIVIDAAFKGIVPGGDYPLFNDGAPSANTQQAIDFCKAYEVDRKVTEHAMQRLAGFDLITIQAAQFTPVGSTEQKTISEYYAIDGQRLDQLPDDRFLELRKAGLLPLLYAQMMSFANWRDLLNRRAKRHGLSQDAILNPVQLN